MIIKAGLDPLTDLAEFLEPFGCLVRRSQTRHALERYTTGLLADLGRKTASDLGRALAGTNGQRLQEFLTRSPWEPAELDRLRVRHMVDRASMGMGVQVIDDTGFAKKGTHSVGVARQYSGTLGRVDNCQVVVTSHYVDRSFDWPIAGRLYLPETWAQDAARLQGARVPAGTSFKTKGEIALDLIDAGIAAGVPTWAVLADAGYGDQPSFLEGLERRALPHVVGVASNVQFRPAEEVELDSDQEIPPAYGGRGRPRRARRLEDRIASRDAGALMDALAPGDWSTIRWREGTKGNLAKRFARVHVYRVGQRGKHLPTRGWLIGERPQAGHQGDSKYYFAWGLDSFALRDLVTLAHCRWVIERFYQDAKGELGLDDYEGRFWTGLHRHLALVMLAHCYLTWRRSDRDNTSPPETGSVPLPGPEPSTTPVTGFPPSGPTKLGRRAPSRAGAAVCTGHRGRRARSGWTLIPYMTK